MQISFLDKKAFLEIALFLVQVVLFDVNLGICRGEVRNFSRTCCVLIALAQDNLHVKVVYFGEICSELLYFKHLKYTHRSMQLYIA